MTEIEMNYPGPHWSYEAFDCSMPLALDTYSRCGYDCQYCFAFYQKTNICKGYKEHITRSVNPARVKDLFDAALRGKSKSMYAPYIHARKLMQWGALADQFDGQEKRHRVTLALMRYFDSIDYPLSFSTKGAWWTKDAAYMNLMKRHRHNWHVKVSIITNDVEKARLIERGCPRPAERVEAIRRLANIGIHTTLRLRPYIIGASEDFKALITDCRAAGADSVSTEFFCMDARAYGEIKTRYANMSGVLGYDIYRFYMDRSSQHGYKRLSREMKVPILREMRDHCHKLGMRFLSSDNFCREFNDGVNCCGTPDDWNAQTGHFSNAILIAREKGEVRWSDIEPEILRFFTGTHPMDARCIRRNAKRAQYAYMTLADFFRDIWNQPRSGVGLVKAYGGILVPVGRDESGDVIYKFNTDLEPAMNSNNLEVN